MSTPWHTALRIGGLVIPCGAHLGVNQSHEPLLEAESYVTWNSIPEMRGPLGERDTDIERIEISVDHRWGPHLRKLKLGQVVALYSTEKEAFTIEIGETSTVLPFFPVPLLRPDPRKPHGYQVLAFAGTSNDRVPVAVAGRTVSIAAPLPYPVAGQFMPIRPMRVERKAGKKVVEIEGRQSWGLTLVDTTEPPGWNP